MPNAPNADINGVARYAFLVNKSGQFSLQLDGDWHGNSYNSPVEDPYAKTRPSWQLNTHLMWASPQGQYTAEAYVMNIANVERDITAYPTEGADWAETVIAKPRTWGIRGGLKF
jgi:hypothetical protein